VCVCFSVMAQEMDSKSGAGTVAGFDGIDFSDAKTIGIAFVVRA
jgi:hypothetical protein